MRIILMTYSSDENFNGDCDYAVVDLTPELVQQIIRRIELARQVGLQDAELWELCFWGGTAEFYESGVLEGCQEAVAVATTTGDGDQAAQEWLLGLEQTGHVRLPVGVDLKAYEPQRTESDQMIVRCSLYSNPLRFEIAWTASPKHSDVYVTTSELALPAMESYIRPNEMACD